MVEKKQELIKKEESKKEESKKNTRKNNVVKKEEAITKGKSYPLSKKQCMYICSFIRYKRIDDAIKGLNSVILMKKSISFKGEIPHRTGSGGSGRYPIKASQYFINLLKSLRGNALVNGLELEKTRISLALANWASRPMKRGGALAKRTNILLKAKEYPIKEGK